MVGIGGSLFASLIGMTKLGGQCLVRDERGVRLVQGEEAD